MDHTILIDECQHAKIALGLVDLGEGQKTIVRGVCTGNYLPPAIRETDIDEDYHYPSQAQRLIQITWTAAKGSDVVHSDSVHYITKFDTTRRWFLFEEDVIVSYPKDFCLSLTVVFGPWAGNASRLFELAGDRNKATEAAAKVTQILPVRGMLACLLRSSADTPEHTVEDKGRIYLALGGPGVGKTSGRIVDCIQDVCREGKKRVLLISSHCQVRKVMIFLTLMETSSKYQKISRT